MTLELGDVVVTLPIPRGWSAHATRSGGQLIAVTFTPDHHGQSIRVMQSCFGGCDAIDRNLAELLDRRRDSFTTSGWTVDVVRATARVGAIAFELRIASGASVTFDTTRAEHQPAWRQAIECQATSSGDVPRPAVRTACDRMTITTRRD